MSSVNRYEVLFYFMSFNFILKQKFFIWVLNSTYLFWIEVCKTTRWILQMSLWRYIILKTHCFNTIGNIHIKVYHKFHNVIFVLWASNLKVPVNIIDSIWTSCYIFMLIVKLATDSVIRRPHSGAKSKKLGLNSRSQ